MHPEESHFKFYLSTLWSVLTSPTYFFKKLRDQLESEGTLPIVFSVLFTLITHWIGAALSYLWKSWTPPVTLDSYFDSPSWENQGLGEWKEQIIQWTTGMGSVLVDPFKTLFLTLGSTLLIWIASRIFTEKNNSFESALVLVAFSGGASSLLTAIPWIGFPLASLYGFVLLLIGARELYRVGSGRALIIATFPKILFLILVLGAISFVLFFFFALFQAIFSF